VGSVQRIETNFATKHANSWMQADALGSTSITEDFTNGYTVSWEDRDNFGRMLQGATKSKIKKQLTDSEGKLLDKVIDSEFEAEYGENGIVLWSHSESTTHEQRCDKQKCVAHTITSFETTTTSFVNGEYVTVTSGGSVDSYVGDNGKARTSQSSFTKKMIYDGDGGFVRGEETSKDWQTGADADGTKTETTADLNYRGQRVESHTGNVTTYYSYTYHNGELVETDVRTHDGGWFGTGFREEMNVKKMGKDGNITFDKTYRSSRSSVIFSLVVALLLLPLTVLAIGIAGWINPEGLTGVFSWVVGALSSDYQEVSSRTWTFERGQNVLESGSRTGFGGNRTTYTRNDDGSFSKSGWYTIFGVRLGSKKFEDLTSQDAVLQDMASFDFTSIPLLGELLSLGGAALGWTIYAVGWCADKLGNLAFWITSGLVKFVSGYDMGKWADYKPIFKQFFSENWQAVKGAVGSALTFLYDVAVSTRIFLQETFSKIFGGIGGFFFGDTGRAVGEWIGKAVGWAAYGALATVTGFGVFALADAFVQAVDTIGATATAWIVGGLVAAVVVVTTIATGGLAAVAWGTIATALFAGGLAGFGVGLATAVLGNVRGDEALQKEGRDIIFYSLTIASIAVSFGASIGATGLVQASMVVFKTFMAAGMVGLGCKAIASAWSTGELQLWESLNESLAFGISAGDLLVWASMFYVAPGGAGAEAAKQGIKKTIVQKLFSEPARKALQGGILTTISFVSFSVAAASVTLALVFLGIEACGVDTSGLLGSGKLSSFFFKAAGVAFLVGLAFGVAGNTITAVKNLRKDFTKLSDFLLKGLNHVFGRTITQLKFGVMLNAGAQVVFGALEIWGLNDSFEAYLERDDVKAAFGSGLLRGIYQTFRHLAGNPIQEKQPAGRFLTKKEMAKNKAKEAWLKDPFHGAIENTFGNTFFGLPGFVVFAFALPVFSRTFEMLPILGGFLALLNKMPESVVGNLEKGAFETLGKGAFMKGMQAFAGSLLRVGAGLIDESVIEPITSHFLDYMGIKGDKGTFMGDLAELIQEASSAGGEGGINWEDEALFRTRDTDQSTLSASLYDRGRSVGEWGGVKSDKEEDEGEAGPGDSSAPGPGGSGGSILGGLLSGLGGWIGGQAGRVAGTAIQVAIETVMLAGAFAVAGVFDRVSGWKASSKDSSTEETSSQSSSSSAAAPAQSVGWAVNRVAKIFGAMHGIAGWVATKVTGSTTIATAAQAYGMALGWSAMSIGQSFAAHMANNLPIYAGATGAAAGAAVSTAYRGATPGGFGSFLRAAGNFIFKPGAILKAVPQLAAAAPQVIKLPSGAPLAGLSLAGLNAARAAQTAAMVAAGHALAMGNAVAAELARSGRPDRSSEDSHRYIGIFSTLLLDIAAEFGTSNLGVIRNEMLDFAENVARGEGFTDIQSKFLAALTRSATLGIAGESGDLLIGLPDVVMNAFERSVAHTTWSSSYSLTEEGVHRMGGIVMRQGDIDQVNATTDRTDPAVKTMEHELGHIYFNRIFDKGQGNPSDSDSGYLDEIFAEMYSHVRTELKGNAEVTASQESRTAAANRLVSVVMNHIGLPGYAEKFGELVDARKETFEKIVTELSFALVMSANAEADNYETNWRSFAKDVSEQSSLEDVAGVAIDLNIAAVSRLNASEAVGAAAEVSGRSAQETRGPSFAARMRALVSGALGALGSAMRGLGSTAALGALAWLALENVASGAQQVVSQAVSSGSGLGWVALMGLGAAAVAAVVGQKSPAQKLRDRVQSEIIDRAAPGANRQQMEAAADALVAAAAASGTLDSYVEMGSADLRQKVLSLGVAQAPSRVEESFGNQMPASLAAKKASVAQIVTEYVNTTDEGYREKLRSKHNGLIKEMQGEFAGWVQARAQTMADRAYEILQIPSLKNDTETVQKAAKVCLFSAGMSRTLLEQMVDQAGLKSEARVAIMQASIGGGALHFWNEIVFKEGTDQESRIYVSFTDAQFQRSSIRAGQANIFEFNSEEGGTQALEEARTQALTERGLVGSFEESFSTIRSGAETFSSRYASLSKLHEEVGAAFAARVNGTEESAPSPTRMQFDYFMKMQTALTMACSKNSETVLLGYAKLQATLKDYQANRGAGEWDVRAKDMDGVVWKTAATIGSAKPAEMGPLYMVPTSEGIAALYESVGRNVSKLDVALRMIDGANAKVFEEVVRPGLAMFEEAESQVQGYLNGTVTEAQLNAFRGTSASREALASILLKAMSPATATLAKSAPAGAHSIFGGLLATLFGAVGKLFGKEQAGRELGIAAGVAVETLGLAAGFGVAKLVGRTMGAKAGRGANWLVAATFAAAHIPAWLVEKGLLGGTKIADFGTLHKQALDWSNKGIAAGMAEHIGLNLAAYGTSTDRAAQERTTAKTKHLAFGLLMGAVTLGTFGALSLLTGAGIIGLGFVSNALLSMAPAFLIHAASNAAAHMGTSNAFTRFFGLQSILTKKDATKAKTSLVDFGGGKVMSTDRAAEAWAEAIGERVHPTERTGYTLLGEGQYFADTMGEDLVSGNGQELSPGDFGATFGYGRLSDNGNVVTELFTGLQAKTGPGTVPFALRVGPGVTHAQLMQALQIAAEADAGALRPGAVLQAGGVRLVAESLDVEESLSPARTSPMDMNDRAALLLLMGVDPISHVLITIEAAPQASKTGGAVTAVESDFDLRISSNQKWGMGAVEQFGQEANQRPRLTSALISALENGRNSSKLTPMRNEWAGLYEFRFGQDDSHRGLVRFIGNDIVLVAAGRKNDVASAHARSEIAKFAKGPIAVVPAAESRAFLENTLGIRIVTPGEAAGTLQSIAGSRFYNALVRLGLGSTMAALVAGFAESAWETGVFLGSAMALAAGAFALGGATGFVAAGGALMAIQAVVFAAMHRAPTRAQIRAQQGENVARFSQMPASKVIASLPFYKTGSPAITMSWAEADASGLEFFHKLYDRLTSPTEAGGKTLLETQFGQGAQYDQAGNLLYAAENDRVYMAGNNVPSILFLEDQQKSFRLRETNIVYPFSRSGPELAPGVFPEASLMDVNGNVRVTLANGLEVQVDLNAEQVATYALMAALAQNAGYHGSAEMDALDFTESDVLLKWNLPVLTRAGIEVWALDQASLQDLRTRTLRLSTSMDHFGQHGPAYALQYNLIVAYRAMTAKQPWSLESGTRDFLKELIGELYRSGELSERLSGIAANNAFNRSMSGAPASARQNLFDFIATVFGPEERQMFETAAAESDLKEMISQAWNSGAVDTIGALVSQARGGIPAAQLDMKLAEWSSHYAQIEQGGLAKMLETARGTGGHSFLGALPGVLFGAKGVYVAALVEETVLGAAMGFGSIVGAAVGAVLGQTIGNFVRGAIQYAAAGLFAAAHLLAPAIDLLLGKRGETAGFAAQFQFAAARIGQAPASQAGRISEHFMNNMRAYSSVAGLVGTAAVTNLRLDAIGIGQSRASLMTSILDALPGFISKTMSGLMIVSALVAVGAGAFLFFMPSIATLGAVAGFFAVATNAFAFMQRLTELQAARAAGASTRAAWLQVALQGLSFAGAGLNIYGVSAISQIIGNVIALISSSVAAALGFAEIRQQGRAWYTDVGSLGNLVSTVAAGVDLYFGLNPALFRTNVANVLNNIAEFVPQVSDETVKALSGLRSTLARAVAKVIPAFRSPAPAPAPASGAGAHSVLGGLPGLLTGILTGAFTFLIGRGFAGGYQAGSNFATSLAATFEDIMLGGALSLAAGADWLTGLNGRISFTSLAAGAFSAMHAPAIFIGWMLGANKVGSFTEQYRFAQKFAQKISPAGVTDLGALIAKVYSGWVAMNTEHRATNLAQYGGGVSASVLLGMISRAAGALAASAVAGVSGLRDWMMAKESAFVPTSAVRVVKDIQKLSPTFDQAAEARLVSLGQKVLAPGIEAKVTPAIVLKAIGRYAADLIFASRVAGVAGAAAEALGLSPAVISNVERKGLPPLWASYEAPVGDFYLSVLESATISMMDSGVLLIGVSDAFFKHFMRDAGRGTVTYGLYDFARMEAQHKVGTIYMKASDVEALLKPTGEYTYANAYRTYSHELGHHLFKASGIRTYQADLKFLDEAFAFLHEEMKAALEGNPEVLKNSESRRLEAVRLADFVTGRLSSY
ncbi:MAG: hypothetical protein WC352_04280, partial [Candidatus Omnitrophota bacterium]